MEGIQPTEFYCIENLNVNCKEIKQSLRAYVDRELPVSDQLTFEAHLRSCEQCRHEVAGYKLVVETAKELDPVPVPIDVQNRLRAELNRRLGISLPFIE